MARVIPNEQTWIGFADVAPLVLDAPTQAEIDAATNLTCFCSSLNASSQGNTIPTPDFCTLFETSINGTSSAQFQADFYRDDTDDLAWDTLTRGTRGVFYVSRFGGSGPEHEPQATEKVEVWPVQITSRTAGALSSNTPQTFSVTCAVPQEPAEDAAVAAAAP